MIRLIKDYKRKQLKIFIHFLKEYGIYLDFRKAVQNVIENQKNNYPYYFYRLTEFDLYSNIIYDNPPTNFINVISYIYTHKDFVLVKKLWCMRIMECIKEKSDIFDSIDKKNCKTILNLRD